MSESRRVAARNLLRFFRPAVPVFFLVLVGCATAASDNPFAEATNTDVFILRVESRNTFDVSVYINPAGRRELIGTVQRSGVEYLEFEYPVGRLLRLELENTVGDRYRIPPPPFTVGGRLELIVASDLRRSVLTY